MGDFRKNRLQTDFKGITKKTLQGNIWGKKYPALKRNISCCKILEKKIFYCYVLGKKILSPEVLGKNFLPKPNHPYPLPPKKNLPLKHIKSTLSYHNLTTSLNFISHISYVIIYHNTDSRKMAKVRNKGVLLSH